MRSTLCLLALSLSAAIPTLAHADTFTTFNLTGVTLQTGAATGTVTFDITTGQVTSANVLASNGVSNFTFNTLSGVTTPTAVDTFFNLSDSASDIFQISVPLLTTVGYTGSVLCNYTVRCSGFVGGYFPGGNINGPGSDYIASGSLTPLAAPSVTPEPGSLALLGTGILALTGAARRKLTA